MYTNEIYYKTKATNKLVNKRYVKLTPDKNE